MTLDVKPVTPDQWNDLESLFGSRGACGGCWCMWWRLNNKQFGKLKGGGNRKALKALIDRGVQPGLIAYSGSEPIGWVAVAPRQTYERLANSKVLAPIDDVPVWSVVCFFIAKGFRRQGVSRELLAAACDFAQERGAEILEGYPIPEKEDSQPDPFIYTGMESIFEAQGFQCKVRRGKIGRGIWRKKL